MLSCSGGVGLGTMGRVGAWVAACAVLVSGMLATPLATSFGASLRAPAGWVAHSAYGLQLSVPKAWAVAYFQNCPVRDNGTLLIGTPSPMSFCAMFPVDADIVWMRPQESGRVFSGHVSHLVVGGVHVTSYATGDNPFLGGTWVVPSRDVVIWAMGAGSSAVLHTLTVATSRALPALGMLRGSEYLIALIRTPVTGLVTVTRLRPRASTPTTVHAYDAAFWDMFPPGQYVLAGHAGNALCSSVEVTVRSGETTVAPEIDCQGD